MLGLITALIAFSSAQTKVLSTPVESSDTQFQNLNLTLSAQSSQLSRYNNPAAETKEFTIVALLKVNWFAAAHLCSAYGLTLASITTPAEAYDLEQYISKAGMSGDSFWISGNNLVDQKRFFWLSNGELFSYTNWAPKEPNNYGGNENCVEMRAKANGKWNDANCNVNRYFICENRCPLSSEEMSIY